MLPSTAASKIQRVWRRGGVIKLGNKLHSKERECFINLSNNMLENVDLSFMLRPSVSALFQRWVMKLLTRCGVPNASQLSLHPHLMACWFVAVNKPLFLGETTLTNAAEDLVCDLLDLIEINFTQIRELHESVRIFLEKYTRWHARASQPFTILIRSKVIEAISGISKEPTPLDVSMVQFKKLMSLYLVIDPLAESFVTSPVYLAIVSSGRNKFCFKGVPRAKAIHEIMHDPNYQVCITKSIPELSSDHTIDGRIVDSVCLRDDMMSLLISLVHGAAVIEQIVNAFYTARGLNTFEFAQTIYNVFMKIIATNIPFKPQVLSEWQLKKDSQPLEVLVDSMRLLHNLLENTGITHLRQHMPDNLAFQAMTPQTFSHLQVRETARSSEWIRSALDKCSNAAIEALSKGNPYALLEFFDNSILDLVVRCQELTNDTLPEFLRFDRDRLSMIQMDLSMCSFQQSDLLELINSKKWMGPPCPALLLETASRFGAILQFSRFCHGPVICNLIVQHATERILG